MWGLSAAPDNNLKRTQWRTAGFIAFGGLNASRQDGRVQDSGVRVLMFVSALPTAHSRLEAIPVPNYWKPSAGWRI